jgi:hypothetical protein
MKIRNRTLINFNLRILLKKILLLNKLKILYMSSVWILLLAFLGFDNTTNTNSLTEADIAKLNQSAETVSFEGVNQDELDTFYHS